MNHTYAVCRSCNGKCIVVVAEFPASFTNPAETLSGPCMDCGGYGSYGHVCDYCGVISSEPHGLLLGEFACSKCIVTRAGPLVESGS